MIPFSIGKHYKEEITCDFIDMDACHIILGRPWQYDTNSIHKGKPNVYVFDCKGRKIALIPTNGL